MIVFIGAALLAFQGASIAPSLLSSTSAEADLRRQLMVAHRETARLQEQLATQRRQLEAQTAHTTAAKAEATELWQQIEAQAAHNKSLEAQLDELKALMAATKRGIDDAAAAPAPTEPTDGASRGKRARQ